MCISYKPQKNINSGRNTLFSGKFHLLEKKNYSSMTEKNCIKNVHAVLLFIICNRSPHVLP